MIKALFAAVTLVTLTACSGANVTSQIRDFDATNSAKMLRCVTVETGDSDTNEELAAYDGWSLVYASEYTTDNKSTTELTMCFEKAL
ncbi:hypothetical protein [Vibrio panuliri]|uniref:Lipoprotein n=1 Tax=Vibrio panuliri TaxID=1381081 RepID=A0A1Q9HQ56_9VIBR|nr:hypothetical protein [Vibrio panuliri]KAB1457841.1 hypothetical protein F7O85_08925 [Vibrio panuliri]OLQ92966.1 hypothetical protein BIY22_00265 [Vibrio panuliri]OLQ96274.1 hypothetical protein BIY20_19570 [Vibrio panuliri]